MKCQHAGSMGIEVSGLVLGWCPHCGALQGPHRLLEQIAENVGKSNPLSPRPVVRRLSSLPGQKTPECVIDCFGRNAPTIIGAGRA